jgi:hypothetical protein
MSAIEKNPPRTLPKTQKITPQKLNISGTFQTFEYFTIVIYNRNWKALPLLPFVCD